MNYTDIVATINKLVQANNYLCEVEKQGDGSHLLKYAEDLSGNSVQSNSEYWVGNWNRKQFDKIVLLPGTTLKIRELDDEEKQYILRKWEDLQTIKKDALLRLENEYLQRNGRR